LGRSVFSVLLLDLGQVFQLDSLALEDGTLHILDHLFLLLAELVVTELHAMDFLAHGNNLGLTDLGVKSVLHFFLELDLALPEEDLSLSLNNLSQDFSLLLFLLRDLIFKLDALVLKFLQFLLEFVLDVLILTVQFLLRVVILVVDIVQLVHFEIKILQGNLELSDLTRVALNSIVETHLLLLQNRLLVSKLVSLGGDLLLGGLLFDQSLLV